MWIVPEQKSFTQIANNSGSSVKICGTPERICARWAPVQIRSVACTPFIRYPTISVQRPAQISSAWLAKHLLNVNYRIDYSRDATCCDKIHTTENETSPDSWNYDSASSRKPKFFRRLKFSFSYRHFVFDTVLLHYLPSNP
ncbi:hypothetical protein Trydic_g18968 [Trypoxylus dichotomus]